MRSWVPVAGLLIVFGLAVAAYKILVLGYPVITADEPGVWRVELVVNMTGQGGRAVAEVPLPSTSAYHRLVGEQVRSGNLRFSIQESDGSRRGRWSGNLEGTTTVSYEATIETRAYRAPIPEGEPVDEDEADYPKSVASELEPSPGVESNDPAIAELSRELALDDDDKAALARDIFAFVSREIGTMRSPRPMDALSVVREGRGNDLGRARLFCALARANDLPCRVIGGLVLTGGMRERLNYWNEAWLGGRWVPFDATEGRDGSLPPNRIALARDPGDDAVEFRGVASSSYRFYEQSELETYSQILARRLAASQHPLDRLSLLFMPVQVQRMLRIILLVPFGALVMCVLRNMVGLRTFGMFMPMLIALAMTGTGLLWGTLFLAVIVSMALVSRILIKRLYLLLAARIAFILTLVVLLMVVVVYLGDRLDMPTGGVSAFPFVIMTMIVERISVSLEEEGWQNTMSRVGNTLLSTYLTYAVIQARELQEIFLVFPETLFVILGLLIAVGRYTGYRLTELVRFRELAG
jgi:transglutaminase-like putative cysteine protease